MNGTVVSLRDDPSSEESTIHHVFLCGGALYARLYTPINGEYEYKFADLRIKDAASKNTKDS